MKYGLAACFLATFLIFGMGAVDPNAPRVFILSLAAAAGLLYFTRTHLHLTWAGASALALFGYFIVALLWSGDWMEGLNQLRPFLVYLTVFFIVERMKDFRQIVPGVVLIGLAGALALRSVFPEVDGGFGNPNFLTEFVILCLPLSALLLWRRA